jgi:hypothetical protein
MPPEICTFKIRKLLSVACCFLWICYQLSCLWVLHRQSNWFYILGVQQSSVGNRTQSYAQRIATASRNTPAAMTHHSSYVTRPNPLTAVRITSYALSKLPGRDSAVGIAISYGLHGPRIESRSGRDYPHPSRLALGTTRPPIQWMPSFFLGGKAAGAWS